MLYLIWQLAFPVHTLGAKIRLKIFLRYIFHLIKLRSLVQTLLYISSATVIFFGSWIIWYIAIQQQYIWWHDMWIICCNLKYYTISHNLEKKKRQRSIASTRRVRSLAKARRGDVLKPSKSCPQGSFYLLIHFEKSSQPWLDSKLTCLYDSMIYDIMVPLVSHYSWTKNLMWQTSWCYSP